MMTSPSSPRLRIGAAQSRARGRRVAAGLPHQHAFNANRARDRLIRRDDADAGDRRAARRDQLRHHARHGVDRHREANARIRARRREDRRGHADHAPSAIEQRPAGIAGIDRGVSLDHVRDFAAFLRRQLAPERADDAGR